MEDQFKFAITDISGNILYSSLFAYDSVKSALQTGFNILKEDKISVYPIGSTVHLIL